MPGPRFISVSTMILTAVWAASADAQLFGDVSLNPNRKIKAQDDALNTTGRERFVRGNRSLADFVGAAAAIGESRFVGSAATGGGPTVTTSAVIGLTEEAVPAVNVPRTRRRAGIYDERLTIGFDYKKQLPENTDRNTSVEKNTRGDVLRQFISNRGYQLTFSADGATVRLQGTVQTPEQRRLAELIVLFEPGISSVENELQLPPVIPE